MSRNGRARALASQILFSSRTDVDQPAEQDRWDPRAGHASSAAVSPLPRSAGSSDRGWPVSGRTARCLVQGTKTSHRWPVAVPAGMEVPTGQSWHQDISDDPGATWTVYRARSSVRRWSSGLKCPIGDVGTILWVQEAWRLVEQGNGGRKLQWLAECTAKNRSGPSDWRRAETLPRSYTRMLLSLVSVEIQRLQSITVDEVRTEGFGTSAEMRSHWNNLHTEGALWDDNPWVWAVSLKPVWERFPRLQEQRMRAPCLQYELDLQ